MFKILGYEEVCIDGGYGGFVCLYGSKQSCADWTGWEYGYRYVEYENFYAIDIVDVDLAAQEAIYNAYENCLIKEVYKSNGSGSPIQYKVSLETTDQRNLVVAFDESGHVLKVMPEDEYLAARKKN